jgi:hypothetical protein
MTGERVPHAGRDGLVVAGDAWIETGIGLVRFRHDEKGYGFGIAEHLHHLRVIDSKELMLATLKVPSASATTLATPSRPDITVTRARGNAPPSPASTTAPRNVRVGVPVAGTGCCASIGATVQVNKRASRRDRISRLVVSDA